MIDLSTNFSIVILIQILGFFVVGWVYTSNKKNKINCFFSLMSLSVLLWVVLGYLSHSELHDFSHLILYRMNLTVVCIFFIFAYYFSVFFPKEGKRNKFLDVFIVITEIFISSLMLFTDLIIKDVEYIEWGINFTLGNWNLIFYTMVYIVTALVFYNFFKKYFTLSVSDKIKVQYFLVGISLFAVFNLIFNVTMPIIIGSFRYYWIGDYSTIFLVILTAYAITKHELLGIKTLITQILIAIISIILIIDLLLLTDDITMQLLKTGILVSFLYFSRGMVESVKKEKRAREELEDSYKKVDKYVAELEDKNEDFGALLNASDVTVGSLDSEKIAQDIVDNVPTNLGYLGYKGAVLVLYNKEKKTVRTCAITKSVTVKKAKKLLGKFFKEHSEPISTDNLVTKTIKTRKIQIGSKLEDFIAPTVSVNICRMIQKLVKAKSFISLPIFSSRKIIGAMIFVGTKPKREITQRDQDILFGFSSHVGASIENAELYEKTDSQMKELGKLNNNLKRANQKLKELIEMKNEFLHITSHQLRTPLTAIRGMISMWYEGNFNHLSKKKKREMLKNICISTERLNNITNDMLNSIELEGGAFEFQFKQLSLEKVIKESINILEFNFDKKGLYLDFDTKNGKIPVIEAEPNYVRQIFLNLIDNACKYTNKGGVDIDIRKSGKYVEITVKDTGIGVSKSDQKNIFQKFTRSKEAIIENAAGSGLGLFIVEKIVKAHYGKIEFYSEGKGKGSTVKVYLPIRQE